MKIIFIGDTHGRDTWKKILQKEGTYDLAVFAGDYVATHEDIDAKTQIDNLKEILTLKEKSPDKIILLRGNHDMQHLGYYWAECSGHIPDVESKMKKLKKRFLDNTQWVYIYNKIIFSHAGVSEVWMKNMKIDSPEDINKLEPSACFSFITNNPFDFSGDSITQPCVWIRPNALVHSAIKGYTQVVGHTPVMKIFNIKDKEPKCKENIWLCDTLPFEYLVIRDDKFEPRHVNDNPTIRLQNRYGLTVYLELLEGNDWVLKGSDSAFEYMTVSFNDKETLSVDPSGGPYIGKDYEISNRRVLKIEEKKGVGYIITLEDEGKED